MTRYNTDCLRTDLPAYETYRDELGIIIRLEMDRENLPWGDFIISDKSVNSSFVYFNL